MIILVTGENGSGKSIFAEKKTAGFGGILYYIATMIAYGIEGENKVNKHIAQRSGLGFITLELPYSVSGVIIEKGASVLLEDASNLLANAMFDKGVSEEEVFEDIKKLSKMAENTVIVTISSFDDISCDEETKNYIAALNTLNKRLWGLADKVFEMGQTNEYF